MLRRVCLILALLAFVLTPIAAEAQTLPDPVCRTLTAVRGTGPITSAEQLGAMLNRVAWTHRADGWGVNRKTGGNRCASPVGEIACDILHRKTDNLIWDVFSAGGVGERTGVSCEDALGPMLDASRPWVAPADPGGGGPIDPGPVCAPDVREALATCTQRGAALQHENDELRAAQDRLGSALSAMELERDDARHELEDLKARPDPACEAKVPAYLKALGVRVGCRIVR